MIICVANVDGEIRQNKPLYIPRLDFKEDLGLSIIGHRDFRDLVNCLKLHISMITIKAESKHDIEFVRLLLGCRGH